MADQKPTYPHVEAIEHWPTQQTIRLLWDQLTAIQRQVKAIANAPTTEARVAALEEALRKTQQTADEALIAAGVPSTELPTGGGQGTTAGPGGGPPETPPNPIPTPLPDPPPATPPEVLLSYRADLCLREDGDHSQYPTPPTGAWEMLGASDAAFAAFATRYKAAGNLMLPCNMVVGDPYAQPPRAYNGACFDLTHDTPTLISRLDRCTTAGLVPMLALNTLDQDGAGPDTIARLPGILTAIRGHVPAAFLGWEINVMGGPSLYEYDELLEIIRIVKGIMPEVILGCELYTPPDRTDCIIYDGRGSASAPDWWRNTSASLIDVVLLEPPADMVGPFDTGVCPDPRRLAGEVGGALCRLGGRFPLPTNWPGAPYDDGSPIDSSYLNNWKGDYGINKKVVLFEYASYHRWESSRKAWIRRYLTQVFPTLHGWGDG